MKKYRVPITISLPLSLLSKIDLKKQKESRSGFICKIIEEYLDGK